MRSSWLTLVLAACTAPRSVPPVPAPSVPPPSGVARDTGMDAEAAAVPTPTADMEPLVVDAGAASPDAALVTAAACAPEDRAFCVAALRLAVRDGNHVAGWGTVRLDGSARRYRFATVVSQGVGHGAYLIEQTPGVAWLLTYQYDGRTQPFRDETGVDGIPAWRTDDDTAMGHSQTFHRGGEWFHFGVRGGVLVVLDYSYSDVELPKDNVKRTFARGLSSRDGTITGGRCPTPCPRLDGFPIPEAHLVVQGPSPFADFVGDD